MTAQTTIEDVLLEYGIETKASWRIFEICKNLFLIERPRMKEDAAIEQYPSKSSSPGMIVMYIKKSLSTKAKALAIQHELSHLVQFNTEDIEATKISPNAKNTRKERMAEEMEIIMISFIKNYPDYAKGIRELARTVRTKSVTSVYKAESPCSTLISKSSTT